MVIDTFSRFDDDTIRAFDEDGKQYDLNIDELDSYLSDNNCYDWALNSVDHNGEHVQYEGKMQFNDWFQTEYARIDIAGFIETKNVKGKLDELIESIKALK
jgi:hypothetical protein